MMKNYDCITLSQDNQSQSMNQSVENISSKIIRNYNNNKNNDDG